MNIISIEDTHDMPYFSIAITRAGDVVARLPKERCKGEEDVGMPEWVHGSDEELKAKADRISKAVRHDNTHMQPV